MRSINAADRAKDSQSAPPAQPAFPPVGRGLLAGEILLGGKQNRVLTEDILLPPGSGPRNVGVYCVEGGSGPR